MKTDETDQATDGPTLDDVLTRLEAIEARLEAHGRKLDTIVQALSVAIGGEDDLSIVTIKEESWEFHRQISTAEVTLPRNGDPARKREAIFEAGLRRWKHQHRSGDGVALTYDNIADAADCSTKWAYSLMAKMADEYDGCHHDTDPETPERLLIDRELLQNFEQDGLEL